MTIDYKIEPVQKPRLNPWYSIWTQPRATIAQIIREDPEKNVLLLAWIAGILHTFLSAATYDNLSPWLELIIALFAGPIAGVATLYIVSLGLRAIGERFGGTGSDAEVRAAIAWSHVPLVWMSPIVLLIFILSIIPAGFIPVIDILMLLLHATFIPVGIWSAIIYSKCLGEVQGFSAQLALETTVLGGLIVAIPLIGCGLLTGTLF